MKTHLRAAFIAITLGSGVACSLVRSFDGFTDGIAETDASDSAAADGTTPDAIVPSDAPMPVDAGPDGRPTVTCKIDVLARYGGATRFDPGFIAGMAVSEQSIYLAAGNQDAAATSLGDAGQVVRIDKASPHKVSVVGNKLKAVASCAPRDSGAVCGVGTNLVLFEADGGQRQLADLVDNIDDVYPGDDGTFALTRIQRDSGIVWMQRGDDTIARPIVYPHRIRYHGGQAILSRIGPAGFDASVEAFDRSGWNAPDAALTGCTLIIDRAQFQLAVNSTHVYWLSQESDLRAAPRACNTASITIDGTFYAIAADERFVFLRTGSDVQLRWADDVSQVACRVDLLDAAAPSPSVNFSTETAAFEGDAVYFVAQPNVAKLTFEIKP